MDYINMLNDYREEFTKKDVQNIYEHIYTINDNQLVNPKSVKEALSIDPYNLFVYYEEDNKNFKNKVLPTALMKKDAEHVKELVGASSVSEINQRIGNKDVEFVNKIREDIANSVIITEDERLYYNLNSNNLFPNVSELHTFDDMKYRIIINAPGSNNFKLLPLIFNKLIEEQVPFDIRTRILDDYTNFGYTDSIVLNTTEQLFNKTCDIVKDIIENNIDLVSDPNPYLGLNVDDLFGITALEKGSNDYYSPMEAILSTVEISMYEYIKSYWIDRGRYYEMPKPSSDLMDLYGYLEQFRDTGLAYDEELNKDIDDYDEMINETYNNITSLNYNDNVYVVSNTKEVTEVVNPVVEETTPVETNNHHFNGFIDDEEEMTDLNNLSEYNIFKDYVKPEIEEVVEDKKEEVEQTITEDDPFFDLYNKSNEDEAIDLNVNEEYPMGELPVIEEVQPFTSVESQVSDNQEEQELSPIEPTEIKQDINVQDDTNSFVPDMQVMSQENETSEQQEEIKDDVNLDLEYLYNAKSALNEISNNEISEEKEEPIEQNNDKKDLSATQLIGGLVDKINESISEMNKEEAEEANVQEIETTPVVEEQKSKQPIMPGEAVDPKELLKIDDDEKAFNGGNNYGIDKGNTGEIKIDSLTQDESKNLSDSLNKTESEVLGSYAAILSYEDAIKPICVSQSGTTTSLIDYLKQQQVLDKVKLDSTITDTEGKKQTGAEFVRDVVIPLFTQNTPDHIFTIDDILSERTIPTEEQEAEKKGFFARLFGKKK